MTEREKDGLKGKVKSVTTSDEVIESKNYFDNTLKKYADKVKQYDENGLPTEMIDNEHNNKYVYKVIDGDLTYKSFQIEKKETRRNSITRLGSELGSETKKEKPKDERYDLKYKYQYNDQGQPKELTFYGNDGEFWKKIVYTYNKNGFLIEDRHYYAGDRINENYFYKYDSKSNLIERKLVLHRNPKNTVSVTTFSDYKLDSEGNWIERTATNLGESDGKELKTVIKSSRKIEYYK